MATEKENAESVHQQIRRFWEHNQEWATCIECGAQWSVVAWEGPNGCAREDFEQVSCGDGFCEDRAAGG